MSDLRIKRGTSAVSRGTDDAELMAARGTRDGALFTADWLHGLALEGRVFCATGGTVTSPITFSNSALLGTEPDFAISVPSGTAIIPIELQIHFEAYGTTALMEFFAATGTGGALGTDTDLAVGTTITNLRTDAPNSSNCSVGVACDTATATFPTTNVCEFWRDGLIAAVTVGTADDDMGAKVQTFRWNGYEEGWFPVLVGAAQLFVCSTSQGGSGFIHCIYAEVPSSSLT